MGLCIVLVEDVRGHVGGHVVSRHVGGGELEKDTRAGKFSSYKRAGVAKIRHRRRGEAHDTVQAKKKRAPLTGKGLEDEFLRSNWTCVGRAWEDVCAIGGRRWRGQSGDLICRSSGPMQFPNLS